MAVISNAQGLLFVSIFTEEVNPGRAPVTTLKGWFGNQQVGQAKSTITDAVVSRRGVVTHTVGDAVLCSFPEAKNALEAAIDIQVRIARAENRASGSIVRAKAGLAYGPVRVIAGKVSGDAVNAAGMLMEKCAPGEILLDKALYDAVGAVSGVAMESQGAVDSIATYRVLASKDATVQMTAPLRTPAVPAAAVATPARPVAPAPAAAAPAAKPAPAASPAASPAAAFTLVLKFGGLEQRFRPAEGDINLGRATDNHVVAPLAYVSRKHAKIVWREGQAYLVNLSGNGTCVRFRETGKEVPCTADTRLEGTGDIALCNSFSVAGSPAELVYFRLVKQ